MKNLFPIAFLCLIFIAGFSCKDAEQTQVDSIEQKKETTTERKLDEKITKRPLPGMNRVKKAPPAWARNSSIYEVNLRQYTPEGTIAAFEKHLPRLKAMGIDILWFMPIHPISETKRKGGLGSYYAVSDYTALNPEHGTLEDFKNLVKKVHEMDMYVILDWVPNHTGWDNAWIKEHPEWYTKNADGEIIDPSDPSTGKSWGWTDVADLDYSQKEMRREMIKALIFWVQEVDIDGYRCDVAQSVPDDFWDEVADALFAIKPVFMLAEAEHPIHRNSENFIMSYGWTFHHLMNQIAKGEKDATAIDAYLAEDKSKFQKGYHMHFTSNHDENSWNGTVFERMGEAHKTMAVLAATFDGMPLVYSGQEAPLKKRLEFFEKDAIDWNNYEYADFYKVLLHLKKRNEALWNGDNGGALVRIKTTKDKSVFAFSRERGADKVMVFLNLTKTAQELSLDCPDCAGNYNEVFTNTSMTISDGMTMNLKPYDYIVLSNR